MLMKICVMFLLIVSLTSADDEIGEKDDLKLTNGDSIIDESTIDDYMQLKHLNKLKRKPNIIFMMADDLGRNDVGWNNANLETPYMNKLAKEGIILDQFYTMPLCSPSRSTFFTGLYAQQLGLQRGVLMPQEPYGIPLRYKLISDLLKQGGYSTHLLGKWHLGFCDWRYTPTYRGFDSFLGFYQGAEENYQHCLSKDLIYDPISNCTQFDFRDYTTPAKQFNGEYSTFVYNDRAIDIIDMHKNSKRPLFMYVSPTSPHFPVQGDKFTAQCQNENKARQEFCGAVLGMDQLMQNITEALKRNDLYKNSIIVFASDNGGDIYFGGNNYPLRGNKGTIFEGGTRVPAFIHSPLLKKNGYKYQGLFHMADWYATFLHVAGIRKPRGLSSVNQWESLSEGKPCARNNFPYTMDVINGTIIGAIRHEDYKLIIGPPGNLNNWYSEKETVDQSYNPEFLITYAFGPLPFNLTDKSEKLFNLADDPNEKEDLATKQPETVKRLKRIFDYHYKRAKLAVKIPQDPAGDPEKFGGTYSPGWCEAVRDVPTDRKNYMNGNHM